LNFENSERNFIMADKKRNFFSRLLFQDTPDKSADESDWVCGCGFENKSVNRFCGGCGTAIPAAPPPPLPVIPAIEDTPVQEHEVIIPITIEPESEPVIEIAEPVQLPPVTPVTADSPLICPNCGATNKETNNFCSGCGTAVIKPEPAPAAPPAPEPRKFCNKCGTKNETMGNFCNKCGNSLI
jgi:membrane protease subunit (stomatin/prohibitin family)